MSAVSFDALRAYVLERFSDRLAAMGLEPETVPDDFDLLTQGVIDSFSILELIADIEDEFGVAVDFEELDADDLTVIGPFCRYVVEFGDGGSGR